MAAALELWIQRYGDEISEESRSQALREWKDYQGPGPEWTDRRKRGLSQPSLPREKRMPAASESPPASRMKRKATSTGPARRRRQKGPASEETLPEIPPSPRGSPQVLGAPLHPEDSQSQTPSQSSEHSYVPPEGPGPCKWQDIRALAGKTVQTERHIPREFIGLWQGICLDILENFAPPEQEGPDRSDLFFVLPKLVLGRPQGVESRKDRIERLNRQFQLASQGEWDTIMQRALARPDQQKEMDNLHPLATSEDGLSQHMAKRLYRAASQGQPGKAWRQLRAPPPQGFMGPS